MSRGHDTQKSLGILSPMRVHNTYKYQAQRPRRAQPLCFIGGVMTNQFLDERFLADPAWPASPSMATTSSVPPTRAATTSRLIDGSQYRPCRAVSLRGSVPRSPTLFARLSACQLSKQIILARIRRSYLSRKDSLMHGTGARLRLLPSIFSYSSRKRSPLSLSFHLSAGWVLEIQRARIR